VIFGRKNARIRGCREMPVRVELLLGEKKTPARRPGVSTRSGYFAHDDFDGTPFWKRIQRLYPSSGFRRWSVGENLLWASPEITAAHAVQLWLRSGEHRKILLDPTWREVGLDAVHDSAAGGVFHGRAVTIVTADFGVRTR
jgi:hypothetical protein